MVLPDEVSIKRAFLKVNFATIELESAENEPKVFILKNRGGQQVFIFFIMLRARKKGHATFIGIPTNQVPKLIIGQKTTIFGPFVFQTISEFTALMEQVDIVALQKPANSGDHVIVRDHNGLGRDSMGVSHDKVFGCPFLQHFFRHDKL